jgi:Ca2+-binding RTX toxin-like protein
LLDGREGDDTVIGGKGEDRFVASEGVDLIEDFQFKADQLEDKDGKVWDLENATFNDEDESVTIDIRKDSEIVGTTTINVNNYDYLIEVKDENGQPGFPIIGGNGGGDGGSGGGDGGNGGGDGGSGGGDGGNGGGDLGGNEVPGFPIVPDYCESNPEDASCKPTIDNEVIEPNDLRMVEVTQKPKNSSFEDIQRGSKQPDKIIGSSSTDKLTGKDKADILNGKGGDDYLYGDNQSDTLRGGKGKDVLQGGSGKDDLYGGAKSDVLYGGPAADVLTGSGGRDVFVLSSGKDVITDFKIGKDDIGLVYALNLSLKQKGDDLLIRGDDNVRTLLEGINKEDFLADQGDPSLLPIVEVDVL